MQNFCLFRFIFYSLCFWFSLLPTAQKTKFSIKDFFSKCDPIWRIWLHLLKKSIKEKFMFCAVTYKAYWHMQTLCRKQDCFQEVLFLDRLKKVKLEIFAKNSCFGKLTLESTEALFNRPLLISLVVLDIKFMIVS